jgi:hypothetical protein
MLTAATGCTTIVAMSESFVDVTYRGLSLGKRVRLTELRPTTGYLEVPQPMPVGTALAIDTDEKVQLDAVVIAIREQTAGADRSPGMVIRPKLEGAAAEWWTPRVVLPEVVKHVPRVPKAPTLPPPVPVIVKSRRVTKPGVAIPEIVDDGQDTGVMEAISPELLVDAESDGVVDKIVAEPPLEDAPKTTAMSAVDLAALGLEPNVARTTDKIPVIAEGEEDDGPDGDRPEGDSEKPEGKARKRRKRSR